jgi:superfamily II helicase
MSATLPNLTLLAGWLDADLYQTDFRPVLLSEHIKIGNKMFDSSFNVVREIRPEVKIQVSQKKKKYAQVNTYFGFFASFIHSLLVQYLGFFFLFRGLALNFYRCLKIF